MFREKKELDEPTEIIVFSGKEKRNSIIKHLDSRALKTEDQVQNLGVLIDTDLNFTSHIKAIIKTAFYHPKSIAMIKGLVAQKAQPCLYFQ